jgi:hypothetical protein
MFEGKALHDQFAETGDGLALRELAWADLVARLAAARDLRRELDRAVGMPGGGFGQFTKLAWEAQDEGKRLVNRNALGAGKVDEAKACATATNAAEQAAQGD